LGFLEAWPFGRETKVFGYWKSLDFLGFSRPKLDLSMGYAGFSLNRISRAPCCDGGESGTSLGVFAKAKR
jgi:hypothetical protein